jgi:L-iditol 2-dehydrogenase
MKYLSCQKQDVVSMLEGDPPQAAAGELVVRLTMCGICGTDTAKVFGDYPKPQKLGHEVVGIVQQVGAGVSGFASGQRVAMAHHAPDPASHYATRGSETMDPQFRQTNIDPGGFAEFIRVPASLVPHTVVAIPNHVPDDRAVFMEPMACCLRALARVRLVEGDVVMVVGVGAVGVLFMPLLKDRGVTAIAADIRHGRVSTALAWGATAGGVPGTENLPAICKSRSEGRGADAVVLTIVNPSTVSLALESLRDGGTLIIFGGKPGADMNLPMWQIWLREINIITSYSATPDNLQRALQLLATRQYIGLEKLISQRMTLADAQTAFERVRDGRESKVVLTP